MTIEQTLVHPNASPAQSTPSLAIAMRPAAEYCHKHYEDERLYPSVTFSASDQRAIDTLIDDIIGDHGKPLIYTADGKTTIWRVE